MARGAKTKARARSRDWKSYAAGVKGDKREKHLASWQKNLPWLKEEDMVGKMNKLYAPYDYNMILRALVEPSNVKDDINKARKEPGQKQLNFLKSRALIQEMIDNPLSVEEVAAIVGEDVETVKNNMQSNQNGQQFDNRVDNNAQRGNGNGVNPAKGDDREDDNGNGIPGGNIGGGEPPAKGENDNDGIPDGKADEEYVNPQPVRRNIEEFTKDDVDKQKQIYEGNFFTGWSSLVELIGKVIGSKDEDVNKNEMYAAQLYSVYGNNILTIETSLRMRLEADEAGNEKYGLAKVKEILGLPEEATGEDILNNMITNEINDDEQICRLINEYDEVIANFISKVYKLDDAAIKYIMEKVPEDTNGITDKQKIVTYFGYDGGYDEFDRIVGSYVKPNDNVAEITPGVEEGIKIEGIPNGQGNQNIVDDETPGMPFDDDDPTVGYFDGDDYINARYEAPSGDEYEADGPTPVTEEVENIADYINAHRTDFELIYKTEMTQNILESFVKKGTTEPVDDDEMARIKKVLDLPPNASNRDIVNRLLEGDGLSDRQLCQLISKCCEFNEKLLERVLNLSAYQYGVLLRELNKSSDGIEITKDSVDNIIDVMQKVADEKVLNDLLLEGIYEDYDLDSEAAKTWFNESINSKFENKEEAISVLYAFSEIIGKEKDGEIKKWLKIDEDVEGQDLRKAVLDKLLSTDLSRDDILNKLKELDSRFGSPYTAEQIEELNKYGYSSKKLNFDELAEWCGDSKVATEYIVRCYEAPEVVGQKLGNHDKDPDKLVEDALVYFQNAERGVLPGQLRNNGDDRDPVTKIRELIKEISEVEYEPSNKSMSGNGIAGTDLSDGGTSADDLVLSEADDDNNNDNWFKRATKSVGKAIGDGWNGVKSAGIWVGKQVGNAGKWIGKQVGNAGKWVGDKTTSVWNSVFKKKKKDNEAEGDAEVKTEKKQKKGNWFKRTVQNVQDLFGKKPDNAFEEWLTLQDAVRTAEKNGDEKEIAKAKKKLEHFERRTRNKAMIEAWKRVNDNLDLAKQNYAKGEDALDHLDELYANVYSASGWGAKNKAYNGDENNPGVEATVAQVSEYSQATITQACEASLNLAEFSEANKNASKKRKDGSDPLCEGTEGWNKYINAVNDAKKYKADKSEKMPTTDERKITQGDYAEETGKAIKGLVKIEAEKEIKSCEAAQAFAQNASETADGAWTELQKQRDAAVSANEEAQKKKTSKDAEAKEQAAKKAYDAAVAQKEIIEAKRNEINGQLTSLSALTVAEVAASRSKIQDMLNGLHTTEEVNAAVKAAEQAYNAAVKKKEELQKKEAEERTKELLQSWGIKELNAPKSRGGSIVQINGTPDLVYEAKYPTGNYNVCMKKGSTTVEEMTGATDTSLLSASVARESNGSEYGVCCKGLPDASGPYFGAIQMSVDNFKKMIRYFLRNHEKYSEECKKAMAMMFGCDLNNFEATLNAKGVEGMMDLLRTTDMTVKYGNRVHGCSSTMPAYQAIFVDHGTQTMQLQADFVTEELGPYYFNRYSINRSGKKVLSGGLSILVDRMKNDRAGGIRPEDINPAVWQLLVTAGIAYGNCDGAGAILSKVIDDSNLTKEEKLAKINSPEMLVEIYKRYPAIDEKAMKFALSRWNHKHSLATAWELSRMVGDKDKETYYRYVYNVYKPWARTHAYVENEQHSEDNLVADAAMAARLQDRSRS